MSVDIPVIVDNSPAEPVPSMNVEPILHEVKYAIERLLETGEPKTIDLRAIPLAPGEDEQIRQKLGTGEAVIHLDALGPSTLTETRYPGVWWVEHRNSDNTVMGVYIEIAHVPSILFPATEDIKEGLGELAANLNITDHSNGID